MPARLIWPHGCEISGGIGISAHERKEPFQYQNAKNVMSFVDGHVGFPKIYWNGIVGFGGICFFYEHLPAMTINGREIEFIRHLAIQNLKFNHANLRIRSL